MTISYIHSNSTVELAEIIHSVNSDDTIKSVMVFMADKDQMGSDEFVEQIKLCRKPVLGGVFPELIYKGERKDTGIVVKPLPFEAKTHLFDLTQDIEKQIARVVDETESFCSMFIFLDALCASKDAFIENLFNYYGIVPGYLGGGAGSLSFKQIPCVIDNSGIHKDAAIIGWSNNVLNLGVAHGWSPVSEPLKVTEIEDNKIVSLDWKPAFTVYKDLVEQHSGSVFGDSNFFDVAKSYPLGITKIDAEMVVRDPFAVDGNNILTVDTVNEGEYVSILHGDMDSLLDGAKKAREMALYEAEGKVDDPKIFCVDCISRVLFMQDDFQKELDAISQGMEITGILSIGEIANSGDSFLEIYNKTIVVSVCETVN